MIGRQRGDFAFDEFLDIFYTARTHVASAACLAEEPPLTGDPRQDAYAGAVAEYLARQYDLDAVPAWL
jgi:hypothetical protein